MRTLWTETAPTSAHPRLEGEVRADVVVVGAGIAGLTAAWSLQKAGARVAVVEAADEVACGESARTSAHLTAVQDTRFHDIASTFGTESARRVAVCGMDAIAFIEQTSRELGIDCGFARVPGFLFTEARRDRRQLDREARAADEAGLRVRRLEEAPLPFMTRGALRFEDQAIFHPLAWLRGLAHAFVEAGGQLFVGSRVSDVEDGSPCTVRTATGSVRAHDVILATDAPIHDRVAIHGKISPWRTYIVTARLDRPLPGLFWDTADPYHYLRTWEGPEGTVVIVGGEDHRVGAVVDTRRSFDRLALWTEPRLGALVEGRWSGQVNEPADGLPFIGRNPFSRHLWVATGFSGTGLVNGTLAAMILSDELQGRTHPLARLFDARRVKPLAQAREAIAHNLLTARWLVGDRVAPKGEARSLEEIPPGEGRIVRLGKEHLAVHRADDGQLTALSPACTHLGCYVHWNAGERSWDCPCHGSRYDAQGQVLHGPAVKALARRPLPQLERQPPAAARGDGRSWEKRWRETRAREEATRRGEKGLPPPTAGRPRPWEGEHP